MAGLANFTVSRASPRPPAALKVNTVISFVPFRNAERGIETGSSRSSPLAFHALNRWSFTQTSTARGNKSGSFPRAVTAIFTFTPSGPTSFVSGMSRTGAGSMALNLGG